MILYLNDLDGRLYDIMVKCGTKNGKAAYKRHPRMMSTVNPASYPYYMEYYFRDCGTGKIHPRSAFRNKVRERSPA